MVWIAIVRLCYWKYAKKFTLKIVFEEIVTMEWVEIFENLGLVLGSSAIFSIASIFVLKLVLEQQINKDLEKFKYKLEQESISHKIKFERLHSEHVEVLKNLYQKMVGICQFIDSVYIHYWGEVDDAGSINLVLKLAASVTDLKMDFEKNKIYLEEGTADRLESIITDMCNLWDDKLLVSDIRYCDSKSIAVFTNEWPKLKVKLIEATSQLENDFRETVGLMNA